MTPAYKHGVCGGVLCSACGCTILSEYAWLEHLHRVHAGDAAYRKARRENEVV